MAVNLKFKLHPGISLEELTLGLFGMSLEEAHEKQVCVNCKRPVINQTLHYEITGECNRGWHSKPHFLIACKKA